MYMNRSARVHQFSMVPSQDVPRSSFMMEHSHKTAFNSGYLIPIYRSEMLPGDHFSVRANIFARLATPLVPFMDNAYLDVQAFFVPYRLVWTNFVKMMGEQKNPSDSIAFTVPQMVSKVAGYDVGSLQDYFGLPTLGQVQAGQTFSHSALLLRAYNLIWNEWYRHEMLQNSVVVDMGDAASLYTDYSLLRRNKRSDYFTSALPSPQKGAAITMPLGTTAPVFGTGSALGLTTGGSPAGLYTGGAGDLVGNTSSYNTAVGATPGFAAIAPVGSVGVVTSGVSGLFTDLSSATAANINTFRLAFQTQEFLEKDARGGTRYVELLQEHFKVRSPDARLQRPEFIGGGSVALSMNPIAQTSGTAASGTTTPLGQLAAMATVLAKGVGFSYAAVEHGCVIMLASVRADLTYQQGLERFWSRSTRYDFYWPVFEALGEQAILNKEIYCRGDANDGLVFGYQERWAEYKYFPSMITGILRSTAATTLDVWHLSQKFTSLPTLNSTFMADTPPFSRVIAVPSQPEFIADMFFSNRAVRPMHMYSIPSISSLL